MLRSPAAPSREFMSNVCAAGSGSRRSHAALSPPRHVLSSLGGPQVLDKVIDGLERCCSHLGGKHPVLLRGSPHPHFLQNTTSVRIPRTAGLGARNVGLLPLNHRSLAPESLRFLFLDLQCADENADR